MTERATDLLPTAGFVLGGVLAGGLLAPTAGGWLSLGFLPALAVTACIGGIALGAIGRRRFTDRCSDRDCEAVLPAGAATCPRCGGTVRGVIDDPSERLAAEEARVEGALHDDAGG